MDQVSHTMLKFRCSLELLQSNRFARYSFAGYS